MVRRSAFRHVLVHLGLAILLPAPALAQAPLCSSVFELKKTTSLDLDQVLTNLAEMKLDVDRAVSRGGLTSVEKETSESFPRILEDLIHSLSGRMSAAQVKHLLRDKIFEIQGIRVEKDNLEQTARKTQNQEVKDILPKQEFLVRVDIPGGESSGKLTYVASSNSLVMQRGQNLVQMDTKTLQFETIEPNTKLYQVNGDEIAIITKSGDVYRYNAKTKAKSPPILQGLFADYSRSEFEDIENKAMVLSPLAEWVAKIDQRSEVAFFNTFTGDKAHHGFAFATPPQPAPSKLGFLKKLLSPQPKHIPNKIIRLEFINKNEVLIFTKDLVLYKFNFLTGATSEMNQSSFIYNYIQLSDNGMLILSTDKKIAVLRADDFDNFDSTAVVKTLSAPITGRTVFLNDDQILVNSSIGNWKFEPVVLDAHTLKPVDRLSVVMQPHTKFFYGIPGIDSIGGRLFVRGTHQPDPNVFAEHHIDIFAIRTQMNPHE